MKRHRTHPITIKCRALHFQAPKQMPRLFSEDITEREARRVRDWLNKVIENHEDLRASKKMEVK